jgi:hypothetical protein
MRLFQRKKQASFNLFGSQSATWLDLSKKEALENIFYTIPEVSAPILWKANAFSNINIGLKDLKKNKEIKYFEANKLEKKILDIFINPNCLQAKTEFFRQYFVNLDVFGNAFNYGLAPDGKFSVENIFAIWNLPSRYTGIETTGKLYEQTEKSAIIKKYVLKWQGYEREFTDVKTVMHKNHVNIKFGYQEEIKGESKLVNLVKPISNLIASYEARNVLISKRGAIGALTGDPGNKDVAGFIPIDDKERKRLQNEYTKYGLSKDQYQILITEMPMKWIPFVFDMNQLKLHEETELDFQEILGVYNLRREIFPTAKGGTFANTREAEKASYQDVIIPEFEDTLKEITNWLGLRDMGYELIPQFDHIPILQVDRMIYAQALQITNSVYQVLWNVGAITLNQWLLAIGLPTVNSDEFEQRNPNPTQSTIPNTLSVQE